jgi:hypothetical protein
MTVVFIWSQKLTQERRIGRRAVMVQGPGIVVSLYCMFSPGVSIQPSQNIATEDFIRSLSWWNKFLVHDVFGVWRSSNLSWLLGWRRSCVFHWDDCCFMSGRYLYIQNSAPVIMIDIKLVLISFCSLGSEQTPTSCSLRSLLYVSCRTRAANFYVSTIQQSYKFSNIANCSPSVLQDNRSLLHLIPLCFLLRDGRIVLFKRYPPTYERWNHP